MRANSFHFIDHVLLPTPKRDQKGQNFVKVAAWTFVSFLHNNTDSEQKEPGSNEIEPDNFLNPNNSSWKTVGHARSTFGRVSNQCFLPNKAKHNKMFCGHLEHRQVCLLPKNEFSLNGDCKLPTPGNTESERLLVTSVGDQLMPQRPQKTPIWFSKSGSCARVKSCKQPWCKKKPGSRCKRPSGVSHTSLTF